MSIEGLKDDLLYLMVFGPGIGESILLRIPPDKWVVIDGCRDGSVVPVAETLKANRGRWGGIIFTHPHADHAVGLDVILSLPGEGFVGCAVPMVPDLTEYETSQDPNRHLVLSAVENVLAKIDDLWTRFPESQWEIRRSDKKTIGDCVITALHPDGAAVESAPDDPNSLSTPVLIEWQGVRLVLGSDLPMKEWGTVAVDYPDIGNHDGMKVPHHGSRGSVCPILCENGGGQRFWVITPFSRQRLPRFDDGEGLALLLQHVDRVFLTALPQRRELHNHVPFETTRPNLRDGRSPDVVGTELGTGTFATEARIPKGEVACYIIAGFDAAGEIKDLRYGPGSLVVTEAALHDNGYPLAAQTPTEAD